MMATDLERAYKALSNKTIIYDTLWEYYDGVQPLRYSTERLKDVFKNISARFTLNWCAVVVDSVLERMVLKQFQVANDEMATRALGQWWKDSGMYLEDDDVHLCAMVTGESFVIGWQNEDGGVEAFYNDSRLVHAFYDPSQPRQMRMAAKWWTQDDGTMRLTLYYPDRLEYYGTKAKADKVKSAAAFLPLDELEAEAAAEAENPFGQIPVFHFRRERRAIKSEMTPSVLDVQDAINKLFSDMMVSSEFGAFKQRYVISNADIGTLKNAPNVIWDLPAGDGLGQATSVGEFSETGLGNFMSSMQALASSIAKISRTPQSYFWLGARADPSGEALIAMEGQLNKKVAKYNERFAAEWERLARFVSGQQTQAIYEDPRTVQPLTQAQTRQTNVNAGIPLKTQLRQEGWSPQDLEQLDADQMAEQMAQQNSLAAAMLNAQREFDQEDGG